MLNKIIYATVVYECKNFDIFAHDYLESVFKQTDQNFELLILSDGVDIANIKEIVDQFNVNRKIIHYEKNTRRLTPIQLRKELIDISYKLGGDILIFSDFLSIKILVFFVIKSISNLSAVNCVPGLL